MKKAFKILVIFPTLDKCGGIERIYLNYYQHLSKNIKIDFITHHSDSELYQKIIKDNGGNLYIMPKLNLKKMPIFIKEIKSFFKNHHDYDIVHCNMANASLFYFHEAKKYNIKTRILHSHECKYAGTLSHAIRNFFLINIGKKLTTYNFACGEDAGKFLFKKDFKVINNAIEYDDFKYNEQYRNEIRNKYNIKERDILIGNVGRLAPVKNQEFLINIIKEMNIENLKLFIVGSGDLEEELKNKIKEKQLSDKIYLINSTDDIAKYYCAFDLFVLPSHYEGLPLVGIEAQASGLPCIFSTNVTEELKITENVKFIELDKDKWKKALIDFTKSKPNRKTSNQIDKKFNIIEQTKYLEDAYEEAYLKNNEGN